MFWSNYWELNPRITKKHNFIENFQKKKLGDGNLKTVYVEFVEITGVTLVLLNYSNNQLKIGKYVRQGIALRGHQDDGQLSNDDNENGDDVTLLILGKYKYKMIQVVVKNNIQKFKLVNFEYTRQNQMKSQLFWTI